MPTYEYECTRCGHHFERSQSMKEPPVADCPEPACAGKGTVKRLIGLGGGLIFKGSGFYANDYKKSGGNGSAQGKNKPGKSEAPACDCPNAGSCPMAEKKD